LLKRNRKELGFNAQGWLKNGKPAKVPSGPGPVNTYFEKISGLE